MSTAPSTRDHAIQLVVQARKVQLASMAAGAIARYGDQDVTVAKRAEVWSGSHLLAGWHHLLCRAARPSRAPST